MVSNNYSPVDYKKLASVLYKDTVRYIWQHKSLWVLPLMLSSLVTATAWGLFLYFQTSDNFLFFCIITLLVVFPALLIAHNWYEAVVIATVTRRLAGEDSSQLAGCAIALSKLFSLTMYTIIKYNYYIVLPTDVWNLIYNRDYSSTTAYGRSGFFPIVSRLTIPFIVLENCHTIEAIKKSITLTYDKFVMAYSPRNTARIFIGGLLIISFSSISFLPKLLSYVMDDTLLQQKILIGSVFSLIFLASLLSFLTQTVDAITRSVIYLCMNNNILPLKFSSSSLAEMLQKLHNVEWVNVQNV